MERVKRKLEESDEEADTPTPVSWGSSPPPAQFELASERKRQRTKLNFSIESIMQSELELSSSCAGNRPPMDETPSPSPSTSSSMSEVEVEQVSSRHQVQQHRQHLQRQHNNNNNNSNNNSNHQQAQHLQAGTSAASSSSSSSSSTNNSANTINQTIGNGDSRLSQVKCQLDNKDMWDKFHSLNTEMIITKTGRRMFPVMKVQFHNLNPNARYAVSMDIVPVDNKRYRYAYHKSCWQVAGKADPSAEPRLYPHPDSPFNGDLLSRQVISFEKVKLTNNEMDKSGHIILNSMHKYQPRVHLIELKLPPPLNTTTAGTTTNTLPLASARKSTSSSDHHNHHHNHHHTTNHQQLNNNNNNNNNNNAQLDIEGYRTFVFPETVFTAVTAYQNQLITKLKIDKNPFAKGFRDSSRLSDLDRNDPFDYMSSLGPSGRFMNQPGRPGSLEAAAAAGANHMDALQLFASAANNPWYSAAAVAAATGQSAASNPFNSMVGATACSSARQAQLQAQMLLAAFACLNNGGGQGSSSVGVSGTSAPAGPDQ